MFGIPTWVIQHSLTILAFLGLHYLLRKASRQLVLPLWLLLAWRLADWRLWQSDYSFWQATRVQLSSEPIVEASSPWTTLWVIGSFLLIILLHVDLLRAKNRLEQPAVIGLFEPRIVVPQSLDKTDQTYIHLHEITHVKRHHQLLRAIALGFGVLLWWNPLIWFAIRVFFTDLELDCDEQLLRWLSPKERLAYADCLLKHAKQRADFSMTSAHLVEHPLKQRLRRIVNPTRQSVVLTMLIICLSVLGVIPLLTSPPPIIEPVVAQVPKSIEAPKSDITIHVNGDNYVLVKPDQYADLPESFHINVIPEDIMLDLVTYDLSLDVTEDGNFAIVGDIIPDTSH